MKKNIRLRILTAAIAALPVMGWTGAALAQYRVDDSHVNDANNRIGSGGYNNASNLSQRDLSVTGNQIVSGNVSGLSYFHGTALGTGDPNYFGAASISPTLDRFNAISAPVNYGARATGQSTAQPYYNGDTQTIAPPVNYSAPIGSSSYTPNSASANQNQLYDARLGFNGEIGAVNSPSDQTFAMTPGEMDLPGPLDTSGNTTALTASPLYGIRDWQVNDPSQQYFLSQYSNVRIASPSDRLNNAAIQQMRNELNNTVVQGPNGQTPDNSGGNGNSNTSGANAGNPNNLAQSDLSTGALPAVPLTSSLNSTPFSGNLNTNQGIQQQYLTLPTPDQQSTQIKDLEALSVRRQKLLVGAKTTNLTAAEATQRFNDQQRYVADVKKANQAAAGVGQPDNGAPTAPTMSTGYGATTKPSAPTAAGVTAPPVEVPHTATPDINEKSQTPTNPVVTGPLQHSADEEPYIVTSLATGIRAKGLADLMTSAENKMRQGHFNAALDSYDSAEQVAPNNPFIAMGRGFAELGAAYYGKAEIDLRRSIKSEPALLAGKYDLKGFLGEDRLKFVVKDLGDIYQTQKDSVRAAMLLGFIAHNQGDDVGAASYLSAADQRAGGQDATVKTMREEWGYVAKN